jgi:hypothetical protein
MRATFVVSATALIAFFVGCSRADRVASGALGTPAVPTVPAPIVTSSIPDVSGSWNWSSAGHLTIPDSEVERLLGIEPEGPITQLRCEATGTMEVSQAGTIFNGSATRKTSRCETGGGRMLELPTATFPETLPIVEGLIKGRAVHFLFGAVAGLGCPHNGAIQDVVEDVARELTATGRCIIPGHPRSPVPRDPPPAGTSHDTRLVATRP